MVWLYAGFVGVAILGFTALYFLIKAGRPSEFDRAMMNVNRSSWVVEYAGLSSEAPDTTVQYWDRGLRRRIDTVQEDGAVSAIIWSPRANYVCDGGSCFKQPGAPVESPWQELTTNDGTWMESEREIADVRADCFRSGTTEICVTPGGAVMAMTFAIEGAGPWSVEARGAPRRATNADFDPPLRVIESEDSGPTPPLSLP
jgi:hypothetical protein